MAKNLIKIVVCLIVLGTVLGNLDSTIGAINSKCLVPKWIKAPVCGSDGVDYLNLIAFRCEQQKNSKLTVKHLGTCDKKPYKYSFDIENRKSVSNDTEIYASD